jgi:hypothetical protein
VRSVHEDPIADDPDRMRVVHGRSRGPFDRRDLIDDRRSGAVVDDDVHDDAGMSDGRGELRRREEAQPRP